MNAGPIKLDFTIDSVFEQSRDVQTQIMDNVSNCKYDEQSVFAIKLALEEAMINAIKHGNKMDVSKKVRVQARITPKRIVLTIEDQGAGFTRNGVPDPTIEENLCKCSGRGILLMESYMNSVTYSKQGRRVRMVRINPRYRQA